MDILKILQKKRNERFREEIEQGVLEKESEARFDNRPPRFHSYLETEVVVRELSGGGPVERVKPLPLIVEAVEPVEVEPEAPEAPEFEVPGRIGTDFAELFARCPVDSERVNPRLVAITQPNSTYCEQYRRLRTHFLQTSQKRQLKTAVVASLGRGEGKSVTALNLSWLLAQVNELRVLIVDADLRRSSLTDYLGITAEKGLSEVLTRHASLLDAIVQLEPSGLCLLPSGEPRSDVAELISGAGFKNILDEAGTMFDVIIIDVPPIGLFSETTVLMNRSDGVILVACADKTGNREIGELMHVIAPEKIIGAVLNQADEDQSETYYEDR